MKKAKGYLVVDKKYDANFLKTAATKAMGAFGKALGVLHRNGIVHGDCGSHNMFFDGDNATFIDYSPNNHTSIDSELHDILYYMPPYECITSNFDKSQIPNNRFQIEVDMYLSFLKEYTESVGVKILNTLPETIAKHLNEALHCTLEHSNDKSDEFVASMANKYIETAQHIKQYIAPYTKEEIAKSMSIDEAINSGIILFSEYSIEEIIQLIKENSDKTLEDAV